MIDLVPTILDVAGITEPAIVNGIEQQPIEGVSMRYSFHDASAQSLRTTQYFEILGNRAVYHDGWIASCFHGRLPWVRTQSHEFGETERWELYRLGDDFSQGVDLAAQYPDKLAELKAVFDAEARKYNVYPLNDETMGRALPQNRPGLLEGKMSATFYRENVRIPELATINFKNNSFDLRARVDIPAGGAEGVIICQGGSLAGWSLYVQGGVLSYVYNYLGHDITTVSAESPLPRGDAEIALSFAYDGGGIGKGGLVTLSVNGSQVATGRVDRTVPFLFSMSGETFDVGVDTGSPVGPYPNQLPFTGDIHRIDVALEPQHLDNDSEIAAGQLHGALKTQ